MTHDGIVGVFLDIFSVAVDVLQRNVSAVAEEMVIPDEPRTASSPLIINRSGPSRINFPMQTNISGTSHVSSDGFIWTYHASGGGAKSLDVYLRARHDMLRTLK